MDNLPNDVYIYHLSRYLTFRDLGNLIKTSKTFKKIYDKNEFWKEIYVLTCPNKWEINDNSIHFGNSAEIIEIMYSIQCSLIYNNPIDTNKFSKVFTMWNCQISNTPCEDISHYNINTLNRCGKIYNYDYKRKVLFEKGHSRLTHKDKNIIFLKQLILPNRLEWYDIVGNPTFYV